MRRPTLSKISILPIVIYKLNAIPVKLIHYFLFKNFDKLPILVDLEK